MNTLLLSKLLKTSTISAITLFFLKKIIPFECHLFYKIDLAAGPCDLSSGPDFSFIRITNQNYSTSLSKQVEQELNLHAGVSLKNRVARGEQAFLVFFKNELACQLFMSHKATKVDSPLPLLLEYGDSSWFLSFLYTHSKFRNKGVARTLINYTCNELQKDGYTRCLAHIRSTNLASINSFEKAGWEKIAKLYSFPGKGKFVNSKKLTQHNIKITTTS